MGRLEVQIRHGGHGPGEWGAVIALIAFVLLAAAGGAAHKALSGAAHDVLTAVEVIAWTLAGLVMLAAATGLGWLAFKVHRAVRAHRPSGPVAASVVRLGPGQYGPVPPAGDRPELDQPRRPSGSWPLPGQWDRIYPPAGRDDDRRRYS